MAKNYDKLFLDIAERISEESNCIALHVGAVLVRENRIVSIGYNGTPSGAANCSDVFRTRPREEHHEWSKSNEIHAEMNAILYAAKSSIPTSGCTLYVTHEPCDNCIKHAVGAGIERIVYKYPYKKRHEFDSEMRDAADIEIVMYDGDEG